MLTDLYAHDTEKDSREPAAIAFARECHARINQRRKFSGEPYIVHPARVVALVRRVPHTEAMLCAAWLHDVVEDTTVPLFEIERHFGADVAELVSMLTNPEKPKALPRATRKAIDREHIEAASPDAQTIKLADIIDNCQDLCKLDPEFAAVYLAEKKLQLPLLRRGDTTLWNMAAQIVGMEFRPSFISPGIIRGVAKAAGFGQ